MSEMWNISSNPHIRDKMKSSDLMRLVLIALLPAAAFGVVNFGINALKVIILSVAASVLTEYVYEKGMHKKVTIGDYSAAVTGLLLALNLPASAPWYLPVLGSVFAILFVKQLFRRTWTELYESGSCSKMFSSDLFCRKNDGLYIRCSIRGNAACSHESRRERECFKPVSRKNSRNDR